MLSDSSLSSYREAFAQAQAVIKRVLDTHKHPDIPLDHLHTYKDKYTLVEHLGGTFILSFFNNLEALGLQDDVFIRLIQWSRDHNVYLSFKCDQRTELIQQTKRKEEAATKGVTNLGPIKIENKVIHEIDEWHWSLSHEWTLSATRGGEGLPSEKSIPIASQKGATTFTTRVGTPPRPASSPCTVPDCDITALLRAFTAKPGAPATVAFTIDRSSAKCLTPRRNPRVEALRAAAVGIASFASSVATVVSMVLVPTPALVTIIDEIKKLAARPLVPTWLLIDDTSADADADANDGGDENANDAGSGSDAADAAMSTSAAAAAAAARRRAGSAAAGSVSLAVAVARAFAPTSPTPAADADAAAAARVTPTGTVLAVGDLAALLRAESEALKAAVAEAVRMAATATADYESLYTSAVAAGRAAANVPRGSGAFLAGDATLWTVLLHAERVATTAVQSIDAVEAMLYVQLRDAIGRVVGPADVAAFFDLHWQTAIAAKYRPHPLAYSVRRGECHPDGTVELLADGPNGRQPVNVFTRSAPLTAAATAAPGAGAAAGRLSVPLSASCAVALSGAIHTHVLLRQRFGGRHDAAWLWLEARARRFSSFVVVLGRLTSTTELQPEAAMLVTDMDSVTIPIAGDVIPTAGEFADAISGLSPEQQAFARSIRALQLSSTLFAFAVLPVKPQLERVLRLPPMALLKEIALTTDATDLVARYAIPPDVIAAGGAATAPLEEQVGGVRASVAAIRAMVDAAKAADAREAALAAKVATLREDAESGQLRGAPMPRVMALRGGSGMGGGGGARMRMAAMPTRMAMPMAMPVAAMAPPPPPPAPGGAPPPPPPPSAPAPIPAPPQEPSVATPETVPSTGQRAGGALSGPPGVSEILALPTALDAASAALPRELQARPVVFKMQPHWTRVRTEGLLGSPKTATLDKDDQKKLRAEAFDLLDALTRSGGLVYEDASVHVVVEMCSSFTRGIVETVIEENVNVLDRIEKASLEVIGVLHGVPSSQLRP